MNNKFILLIALVTNVVGITIAMEEMKTKKIVRATNNTNYTAQISLRYPPLEGPKIEAYVSEAGEPQPSVVKAKFMEVPRNSTEKLNMEIMYSFGWPQIEVRLIDSEEELHNTLTRKTSDLPELIHFTIDEEKLTPKEIKE